MRLADIHADARAVVNTAVFFDELKRSASRLLQDLQASERGYFIPSEDEEVRHVLVAYWQSRNALVEVVTTYRDYARLPEEFRHAGFLVSFAGALVLVDAARFLRDGVHTRPVVRQKLNEPEPAFGIPEGVYEHIQRSLTNPVHVWYLYHASLFFEDQQENLGTIAREQALEPVLEIVSKLQQRLRVSLKQYSVTRLRTRARQLSTAVRQDLVKRAMYGLQKAVSQLLSDKYLVSGHEPSLPESVRTDFQRMLEPGDILVNRKEHALTNYFLPGYWPHALLYLGNRQQLEQMGIAGHKNVRPRWQRLVEHTDSEQGCVIEALKDGVRIRSLNSPFRADAITMLRPRMPRPLLANAIARVLAHDGKPYDFDFDFTRSDRLVCTEVVYRAYEGVAGANFRLTSRAGRLNLSAEDVIRMALAREFLEPVAVYCSQHASQVLVGDTVGSTLEQTMQASGPF